MSRVPWREGKVISVETRAGVFALGQMLMPPYMMFYNIFHRSHDWPNVDLTKIPTLYCCGVVRQFTFASNVAYQKHIAPKMFDSYPKRWIHPNSTTAYRTIWTGTQRQMTVAYIGDGGGSLIEKDIAAKGRAAWKPKPVIMKRIPLDDKKTIDNHELTNLDSFPYANERLYLCQLFGKSVDPYKDLLFERPLPPEYERYMELLKVPDDVLKDLKPGALRVDKKSRSRK